MTRLSSARLAGLAYLVYIATALPASLLFSRATGARDVAGKIAGIAQHVTAVRVVIGLSLFTCFVAVVMGVSLYAVTRDEDKEVATVAMMCRVGEGVLNALYVMSVLGLLWIATGSGPTMPDPSAAPSIASLLLRAQAWTYLIGATFFAVGSALFSWLLLRGRMIPRWMAFVGVIASLILVVGLPLQLVGLLRAPMTNLMWLPMIAFEVPVGFWLLVKGVRPSMNTI